jgi:hypothetical protein
MYTRRVDNSMNIADRPHPLTDAACAGTDQHTKLKTALLAVAHQAQKDAEIINKYSSWEQKQFEYVAADSLSRAAKDILESADQSALEEVWELQKDAERYRWLREKRRIDGDLLGQDGALKTYDALDAAIDAARSKT